MKIKQMEMDFEDRVSDDSLEGKPLGLTFRDSKSQPVHRWYPYVEGFSAIWIREKIQQYANSTKKIYDPFGGSGTTQLEASINGIESYYSEINPFMSFIADTKINASRIAAIDIRESLNYINQYMDYISSPQFFNNAQVTSIDGFESIFPQRDFFEEEHLKCLLHAKEIIVTSEVPEHIKSLILLAISSIAVDSSNMTRRADLRRRREDEYKERIVNVPTALVNKMTIIIDDLKKLPQDMKPTIKVSSDARNLNKKYLDTFDLVVTSPPYLNGTNYIRNTKIELGLLNFIDSENRLKDLREQTVCGGINDVSKNRLKELIELSYINDICFELDNKAYDKRIPLMVRSYFSDMSRVLINVFSMLRKNGVFVLDIGDSKFSGVHIPTDRLITKLAEDTGFKLVNREVLAKRYSRDKTELVQVGLTFQK